MDEILEQDYGIPRRYLGRIMSPWAVKRLHEFNGDISQFRVSQTLAFNAQPDGRLPRPSRATRTIRTFPRWSARWISASWKNSRRTTRTPTAISGGSVPGQPGFAGIRRDVQGADQGAAPAADRNAGRQLQGHRRLRRDSVRWRGAGALQRIRVAASATTRTTRLSSTASTSSRCRTACACRMKCRFIRNCCTTARWRKRPARRARWKCWRSSPY
jgi:hypothetical protein